MTTNVKPYPSWIFDDATGTWKAPVEKPAVENKAVRWNEYRKVWQTIKKPYDSYLLKESNFSTEEFQCFTGETYWEPSTPAPQIFNETDVALWDEENQIWQIRNSLL